MAETDYNELIREHFTHPRNVGVIDDADGVGEHFNPVCGDTTRLSLRIQQDKITEVRFQTKGCPTAIATSSIATELLDGMSLSEADGLTKETVAEAAGGLPLSKLHCSVLVVDALRAALQDYRSGGRD